jgi:peroxin-7
MNGTRLQFSGYSVQFSPFKSNILAVASSQYYGIAGNGRVTILDTERGFVPVAEFQTRDGCFDVAWSEKTESLVAAACGDGGIRIFDTQRPGDRPVMLLAGHTAETYSVDWNMFLKDMICSASWDTSVKVWDVLTGKPISRYGHSRIAYEAKWNPRSDKILASVGGDGKLLISDVGCPNSIVQSVPTHANEVLCLDWNKYRDGVIATGSTDKQIRVWDLRNSARPVQVFDDHQLAVRRIKWSPHSDSLLCSCSYDMSVKLWSTNDASKPLETFNHHSEFVIGLDFSIHKRDVVASTAWDRTVAVWQLGSSRPVPRIRLAAA